MTCYLALMLSLALSSLLCLHDLVAGYLCACIHFVMEVKKNMLISKYMCEHFFPIHDYTLS